MTELHIVAEGPTEESFVKTTLKPHLRNFSIYVKVSVVETSPGNKGGGNWKRWKKHLFTIMGQNLGKDVRFTTLFDLYGLPRDFPGRDDYCRDPDTVRRVHLLEQAMGEIVGSERFIPYLQRHEFEALVLPCLDELSEWLDPRDRLGVVSLRNELRLANPEDVNDGWPTAPSKRLKTHIPAYIKTLHGPLAIDATGLDVVRSKCPRFDAWLTTLESLGKPTP